MIRYLVVLLLWSAASVSACTIPVFRYALDRWEPDYFMLELPKDDPAATEVRASLQKSAANIDVAVGESAGTRLLFPQHQGGQPWPGPVDVKALGPLLDSPMRQKIGKQITSGDAAVWVIVEAGDEKAGAEARAKLEERLRHIESNAELPEQDPMDPSSQLGAGPELAVRFSLMSVKRDDPAEQPLIRMLEAGLEEGERGKVQPVAYPVFGRGRVLTGLPSALWTPETLDEVAMFLLGACSCQVKELNPGWDILMDFAWDDALMAVASADSGEGQPGAGKPGDVAVAPAAAVAQPGSAAASGGEAGPAAEGESEGGWQSRRGLLLGAGSLALLVLLVLVFARSRKTA